MLLVCFFGAEILSRSLHGSQGIADFMSQDRRHLFQELTFFPLKLFVKGIQGCKDIGTFRIDQLQYLFKDLLERFNGNDDDKGSDQNMAEGNGVFSEQARKNQDNDGGKKGHKKNNQCPCHYVVEFSELRMCDNH